MWLTDSSFCWLSHDIWLLGTFVTRAFPIILKFWLLHVFGVNEKLLTQHILELEF